MSYKVHDTKRGHIFATLEEASAYANEVIRKTGYVFLITKSKAKPTHVYDV